MSSAVILADGTTKQLDRRPELDETITPDKAKDPQALARLLTKFFRIVLRLQKAWTPDRIDYQDIAVGFDGVTLYNFAHNFGGRVRWWPVDWVGDTSAVPLLTKDASTTDSILVLRSYASGKVTVRVEAAG